MKKLFNVKIKYDGIPIMERDVKDEDDLDDALRLIRKKFGK